jgi:hypothetical protein
MSFVSPLIILTLSVEIKKKKKLSQSRLVKSLIPQLVMTCLFHKEN